MRSIKQTIRAMDNKHLLDTINKIKKEKENPEVYGKNGTTRWVTASEFWDGHHQDLNAELKRRKNAGLIRKNAGKSKTTKSNGFSFDQLMRM